MRELFKAGEIVEPSQPFEKFSAFGIKLFEVVEDEMKNDPQDESIVKVQVLISAAKDHAFFSTGKLTSFAAKRFKRYGS